jgi:SAM-dependent methyltransferase
MLMATLFEDFTPELHALLVDGERFLELGCGLAGRLLSLLQAYPSMTAVGVELAPDLLEEAQRRAQELGVADRVEFRATDAQEFTAEGLFDLVFWSQFFFPEASRAATLQVAWCSMRPRGYIGAPVRGEPSLLDDLCSEQGR